jgi:hypothetical protein
VVVVVEGCIPKVLFGAWGLGNGKAALEGDPLVDTE